jgi:class 3 adenylate cyclase
MARKLSTITDSRRWALVPLVILLLAGLPLAVWLDLRGLSETVLRRQANDLNSIMTSVRGYYGNNIVGHVLIAPGSTQVVPNYQSIPGAIPIPATFSIELGEVISQRQGSIVYRFVSDLPFSTRAPHVLDDVERKALASLRENPRQLLTDVSLSTFSARLRLIAPVLMETKCVDCHNAMRESPKHDWKVGDVRGIQEITVGQSMASHIFSFRYLLGYFVLTALVGFGFIAREHRQASLIEGMNRKLEANNDFLGSIAEKISRYLSPQVYKSIFSGQKDVTIHTERKKLTIFFSDIEDFTAITERLQPEAMTTLLNEYLTEMSGIALRHGGTIDKFIGDAILVFFGDPESEGTAQDAQACVAMAVDMQRRIAELNAKWRSQGVEDPLRVRMGINTGYCNVGNFGSADRMDYTIVGGEANLAARLQAIAEPGQIVVSYETYAVVRDQVVARPLPSITMKGIRREVVPYTVEGTASAGGRKVRVFSEHTTGLDFYFDPSAVDDASSERIRTLLLDAIATLKERGG